MRNIYGDKASDALSISLCPYFTSPYFRGNLGQSNTGFIEESYDVLAGPLGRMYFAGDGVCARYHATTHGAYISGRESAARVLQDMADNEARKWHNIIIGIKLGNPCTHELFISTAVQLQFDNETPMVVGNSIFAEFLQSLVSRDQWRPWTAGLLGYRGKTVREDIYWHVCEENWLILLHHACIYTHMPYILSMEPARVLLKHGLSMAHHMSHTHTLYIMHTYWVNMCGYIHGATYVRSILVTIKIRTQEVCTTIIINSE